jgi:hypothetical protein
MTSTVWRLAMVVPIALIGGCGPGRATTPATAEGGNVQAAAAEPSAPVAHDAAPEPTQAAPTGPAIAPEDPGPLPWTDPAAMATEILTRCRGDDVSAVVAVSTEVNRRHEIEQQQGQTACESIFGRATWRADAVAAWNGRAGAVRVSHDQAWVQFHGLVDGAVAVVSLKQEGGRWRFDDLFNPPRARFESWGNPL